jgi:hypothetical protein
MGLDAGRISLLTSIAWRDEPSMHVTRAGGSILYKLSRPSSTSTSHINKHHSSRHSHVKYQHSKNRGAPMIVPVFLHSRGLTT